MLTTTRWRKARPHGRLAPVTTGVPRSSIFLLPQGASVKAPSVRETLDYQVVVFRAAHRRRAGEVAARLRGHGIATGTDEEILNVDLTLEMSQRVVAREHDFRDWADAMVHGDETVDPTFEAAVDAVVDGELEALESLLSAHPSLSRAHSVFGHHATLLHYVAANGVEQTKQRSPHNAPEIARALLRAGAEPDAPSASYGGSCTTPLELLVSSCHPADAGVQEDVVEVLCRGGANANGIAEDGSPLWTAITSGYTRAAERLVTFGARVDNLIAAAALGDLEHVERYFGADGRMLPVERLLRARFAHGRPFDPRHVLEYALCYAAFHGHRDVVAFLLSKQPDLDVREPAHGSTAIGMAKYRHPSGGRPEGSPEIVALLEAARQAGT